MSDTKSLSESLSPLSADEKMVDKEAKFKKPLYPNRNMNLDAHIGCLGEGAIELFSNPNHGLSKNKKLTF